MFVENCRPDDVSCDRNIFRTSIHAHHTVLPARTGPVLFTSSKCKFAIPVRDALLQYALEQASLDPLVHAIGYRHGPDLEVPKVSLAGVVINRADGTNYLLNVCEKRPERTREELARLDHTLGWYGLAGTINPTHPTSSVNLCSRTRAWSGTTKTTMSRWRTG